MKRRTRRIISGILIAVGLISYLGAVGTSDFYDEIHQYYPLSNMIPYIIVGTICCILAVIIDRPSRLFKWIAPIEPLFYLFLYNKLYVRSRNARVAKRLRNQDEMKDLTLGQYYIALTYLYEDLDDRYGGLFI